MTTKGTSVTIQNAQGITLKAFRFTPATGAGPFPAVVMMHGCGGAYSYSTPDAAFRNIGSVFIGWGNALASAGYVALLVDSFTGRIDPATGEQVPQNQWYWRKLPRVRLPGIFSQASSSKNRPSGTARARADRRLGHADASRHPLSCAASQRPIQTLQGRIK